MPINQTTLSVEIIKQYPGEQTAARRVKANITGKFFPQGNSNPQSKRRSTNFGLSGGTRSSSNGGQMG
jgi:hypothetical protein